MIKPQQSKTTILNQSHSYLLKPPPPPTLTSTSSLAEPQNETRRTPTSTKSLLKKSQKKFKILIEILNPIPFLPSKTLDFLSHEKLLRCLGLWYFVHIEIGLSVLTFSLSSLPITVPRVVVVMLSLFVLIST